MKRLDHSLREHFADDRRRDAASAPAFGDLVRPPSDRAHEATSVAPDLGDTAATRPSSTRAAMRRWGLGLVGVAAAAVLAMILGPWAGERVGREDPQVDGHVALDVDDACDAAIAALDEQEHDARMTSPTDDLLDPFASETD